MTPSIAALKTPPQTVHQTRRIIVAQGDGIGPEIMAATLKIISQAGARLDIQTIEIGEAVYKSGVTSGIADSCWQDLHSAGVFLKAPITTPSGSGYKSLNVTARKMLGLYANVRPCVSYAPYVSALHPKMDVVIVRENEEDTYAGIEHRISQDVMQCLKLITRPGCEKIVRYAFDYARQNGRKKVTCLSKDNIMKMTDGLFHEVFRQIATEYPDITADHMIIDIGTARVAARPQDFDVIVTENLYGDILSDVAAEVAGSIGLAPSANIGQHTAMFEAVHGSAPDIAGKGIANPSGLLLSSVMMLNHIGQHDVAQKVHNAWLATMENGLHTGDVYKDGMSKKRLNTADFTQAVIDHLGAEPQKLPKADYTSRPPQKVATGVVTALRAKAQKTMIGADVFIEWDGGAEGVDLLAKKLQLICGSEFTLQMISNRGLKVWPNAKTQSLCVDSWRCRFMRREEHMSLNHRMLTMLLDRITQSGLDFVKVEQLNLFDGVPGFTLGQGQ